MFRSACFLALVLLLAPSFRLYCRVASRIGKIGVHLSEVKFETISCFEEQPVFFCEVLATISFVQRCTSVLLLNIDISLQRSDPRVPHIFQPVGSLTYSYYARNFVSAPSLLLHKQLEVAEFQRASHWRDSPKFSGGLTWFEYKNQLSDILHGQARPGQYMST